MSAQGHLFWRTSAFNLPRFGGSGGTTQTVQKADPWAGQQQYITDIYGQAQNLDQTATPQYFPYNTYAPLNGLQQGGIAQLIGNAVQGGTPSLQAANYAVTSGLQPGYTSGTQSAFDAGQGTLARELDPSFTNPWATPGFNSVVGNTLAKTIPAISSSFVGGNRAGGGLAARAVSQGAADAVGQLAQNQYNTNLAVQNAAAQQAANNYLTQQGNQIKLAGLAPLIDQTNLGNLQSSLNASTALQQDQQNQIAADMARYNYNQMLPWNQLALYQNAIMGSGSPGGTTTTQQPYFNNPVSNAISTGSGILGMIAAASSIFSDRRLKTDIHKIGKSDSGFPLYTFRYKGEKPGTMHIGLMAQDVEKKRPGSVFHTPVGMAVDYIGALAA